MLLRRCHELIAMLPRRCDYAIIAALPLFQLPLGAYAATS